MEQMKHVVHKNTTYVLVNGRMIKTESHGAKYLTQEQFIHECNFEHGNLYSYEHTDFYRLNHPIIVTCKIHGNFSITASHHLKGGGCKKCSASKGETRVMMYLEARNIKYEREKTFDDCVNPVTNRKFRYDFYLPTHNIIIEYDGAQHKDSPLIYPKDSWYYNMGYRITRDEFKDNYAIEHGITIHRIPHCKMWQIDTYLEQFLSNI